MSNPRRSSIQAEYDRTREAAGAPPVRTSFAEIKEQMAKQEQPKFNAAAHAQWKSRRNAAPTPQQLENQRNAAAFLARKKQSGDWSPGAIEPPQQKMIEKMRRESNLRFKGPIGGMVQ